MTPYRPRRLVVVAGTATGVGKTWVGVRLVGGLRSHGLSVAARKPAQSFQPGTGATDAELLATATGEPVSDVCPSHRFYPRPMAPFMAAQALGLPPFSLAELIDEVRWPDALDIGLVETAGGVRSPVSSDGGDAVDLAWGLASDLVVLVAEAGLGTLGAVRLCLGALGDLQERSVVLLNRFDAAEDLHARNAGWLRSHVSVPTVTSVDDLLDVVAGGA